MTTLTRSMSESLGTPLPISKRVHYAPIVSSKLNSAAFVIYSTILLSLICLNNASFAFHGTTSRHHPTFAAIHASSSSTRSGKVVVAPRYMPMRRVLCATNIARLSVLSPTEGNAAEVFSLMDADGNGRINEAELKQVLIQLDLDATDEDVSILFRYLDKDGSGEIDDQEFQVWYSSATDSVQRETSVVMDALLQCRTVNDFDSTMSIPDSVLREAVKAAIAAPSWTTAEPCRFINLGRKTISEVATMSASYLAKKDPIVGEEKRKRWANIPGCCVVTSLKSSDRVTEQDDYAATSCAIQNFMLAMWAEGVGCEITTGPIIRTQQFAKLCEVDLVKEQVVGCIWYGFASGGLASVPVPERKRSVDDVLSTRP